MTPDESMTWKEFQKLSNKEQERTLYDLKLGEFVEIGYFRTMTKVIGGWVYTDGAGNTAPSICFIPYPNH